jgi:hypothetical protein
MSKRSFLFGTLALLAGLASATPSQAGLFQTTLSFATAAPGLTEFDLTYSGIGVLSLPAGQSPFASPAPGGTITLTLPNMVAIVFNATTVGPFGPLSFNLSDTGSGPESVAVAFKPSVSHLTGFSISLQQVPEPASLALLGIGMTGLLAFRRYFKKTPPA